LSDLDPRISRQEARRRQIRRRRLTAATVAGVVLIAAIAGAWAARSSDGPEAVPGADATAQNTQQGPTTETAAGAATGTTTEESEAAPPAEPETPSSETRLVLRKTLGGEISPKSVESSGTGLIFAQNMMYRHSVTVYDAQTFELRKTIPDSVQLADFGYERYSGTSLGAPVEAAFSPDGSYAYVSNYSMYGEGFGPEGDDGCTPSSRYDDSFVYRISLETLEIDDAYRVGSVPKVVATTPDGRFVLVANWCTWDLSVISTKRGREVRRIPMGAYPRGIAVTERSDAAYVAIMGGSTLVRVDLRTWKTSSIPIGSGPRALEIDPSGKWVYATLNAEGRVAKLNLRTGRVTKVSTGTLPRSLAMSDDAKALYVVNYESGTVSKLRTRDLKVLQTIPACYQPIGITYDAPTRRVWVACYGGSLLVYNDRR
jgi:DNA-binding beta-propeller fold protein YncE